ncbi:hypothetical protein [Streptomyces sioyaensis]|uniref:hypothetical protein n=1 Tax=Streptomyces sioyaensis TaxID=67364 RepID=UPI003EC034C3
MECQVWTLHVPLVVAIFGAAAFAGGAAASHFSDPSSKYWFGLVPGLIIGGLSTAFILPAKSESWTEKYIFAHYPQRFKSLFGEGMDPPPPSWAKRKWPHIGRQKAAMVDPHYESEDGEWYWGWKHEARIARARTMQASLAELLD